ncbi:hypothetical protein TNCV_2582251 [Trichonephila clavipes]|nr:hypothetical protein TNCV_2582251 [Trichonephila clavipes]
MVTSGLKLASRLQNQLQASGTVTRKAQSVDFCTGSLLSIRRTLLVTLLLCLEEEFRLTVYSRLTETDLYARRPLWCAPLTVSGRKDRILWS